MVCTFKMTTPAACIAIGVLLGGSMGAAQQQYQAPASDTAAQQQYQAILKDNYAVADHQNACFAAATQSPEFTPVLKHAGKKPLPEQFADSSVATDGEIGLLSRLYLKFESCWQQKVDTYSRLSPTMVPIVVAHQRKIDDNFRDLITKKQTWGVFLRRNEELEIAAKRNMDEEAGRILGSLQKAHQAELAEREARDEIELQLSEGGKILSIPLIINNTLHVSFVLDTGATAVLIPADMILTLMRTGALSENDFLGTVTYFLADGSTRRARQFLIREIQVGKHTVRNVTAIEGEPGADGLLGQSFLSKLPSWTLDNKRHVLVMAH
jgi:clan AA aspartic protease (TIGR02281 family)